MNLRASTLLAILIYITIISRIIGLDLFPRIINIHHILQDNKNIILQDKKENHLINRRAASITYPYTSTETIDFSKILDNYNNDDKYNKNKDKISIVSVVVVINEQNSTVIFDKDVEKKPTKRHYTLILSIIPLLTIFGNALVVIAIYREKSLQTVTNLLIVSLAVSDFLVAFCVMSFAVYFEWNSFIWNLGPMLCNLYIGADVACSTASILNLLAISLDRFMAIKYPLTYTQYGSNNCRALFSICVVWCISFGVGLPVFFGANHIDHNNQGFCGFTNPFFIIISSTLSFFVPCGLMVIIYTIIFQQLRARERARTLRHLRRTQREREPESKGERIGSALVNGARWHCQMGTYFKMRSDQMLLELGLQTASYPTLTPSASTESMISHWYGGYVFETIHPSLNMADKEAAENKKILETYCTNDLKSLSDKDIQQLRRCNTIPFPNAPVDFINGTSCKTKGCTCMAISFLRNHLSKKSSDSKYDYHNIKVAKRQYLKHHSAFNQDNSIFIFRNKNICNYNSNENLNLLFDAVPENETIQNSKTVCLKDEPNNLYKYNRNFANNDKCNQNKTKNESEKLFCDSAFGCQIDGSIPFIDSISQSSKQIINEIDNTTTFLNDKCYDSTIDQICRNVTELSPPPKKIKKRKDISAAKLDRANTLNNLTKKKALHPTFSNANLRIANNTNINNKGNDNSDKFCNNKTNNYSTLSFANSAFDVLKSREISSTNNNSAISFERSASSYSNVCESASSADIPPMKSLRHSRSYHFAFTEFLSWCSRCVNLLRSSTPKKYYNSNSPSQTGTIYQDGQSVLIHADHATTISNNTIYANCKRSDPNNNINCNINNEDTTTTGSILRISDMRFYSPRSQNPRQKSSDIFCACRASHMAVKLWRRFYPGSAKSQILASVSNKSSQKQDFSTSPKISRLLVKKATKQMKREQKATVTLAVVLAVFLVCWVPFFTLHLTNGICILTGRGDCVHFLATFFSTWLGYLNSSLNPLIYTLFDQRFRKAFRNILHCTR